jgi:predicted glycogen debranching enzyme
MTIAIDDRTEWLEADGLGGFASGTTSGIRSRRYHALLLAATTPPTGRVVLVNGVDAWVETTAGTFALSSQRYSPGVVHPDGATRIAAFNPEPWPTWQFELPDGTSVIQEILAEHGTGTIVLAWRVANAAGPVVLTVRPFVSGRDYHSLHRENGGFRFDAERVEATVTFRPYSGVPAVTVFADGHYQHGPEWYRNFVYSLERERGLDDTEDLASPGTFAWRLEGADGRATMMLRTSEAASMPVAAGASVADVREAGLRIVDAERRRREALGSPLARAADAYLVRRGAGRTIVAGYPWFTDWGRDAFIAIRGICLAQDRIAEACDILVEWAGAVSEGMLPNRFPDGGDAPEFNSVDASLWYVVAVRELLDRADRDRDGIDVAQRRALERAVEQIVSGYAAGTRYGIRMDADGLLAAGVRGQQLTWMDARVGDREITPRIGKPVEIQALWLNALAAASPRNPAWAEPLARGRRAFQDRFWSERTGCLADVVDVDHVPGTRDDTFRPNQILAVGGLPLALVDGARAARIVQAVESRLVTPLGVRSLAPDSPGYAPHYAGNSAERDAVYHQGTVWPWLMGPFVDAWIHVRGGTDDARREARRRFVEPLVAHLDAAGLGHVSEITDAEPPFTPRGCPFQAWSLGELIRLEALVAPRATTASP